MREALPATFSRPLIPKVIDGSKDQTRRIITPQPPTVEQFRGSDFGLSRAVAEGVKCYFQNDWARLPKHPTDWDLIGSVGVARDAGFPDRYRCPYGGPGGKLWVREDHRILARSGDRVRIRYEADRSERWATLTEREVALLDARRSPLSKPQPGRFMYRSCSRILLEVREVRVERLQDISEEDARAEGVDWAPDAQGGDTWGLNEVPGSWQPTARDAFRVLWDSINGKRDPGHVRRRARKGKPTDRYEATHSPKPGPYSWEANPFVWVVTFSVAEVRR